VLNSATSYVVFSVRGHRLALPLANVKRITRAAAVLPLPGAPAPLRGVVNLQGRLVPVVSLQHWLGLPAQEIQVSDQFIIVQIAERTLVVVVDAVAGLWDGPAEAVSPGAQIGPPLAGVRGVAQHPEGLLLVTDLAPLLALVDSSPAPIPSLAAAP